MGKSKIDEQKLKALVHRLGLKYNIRDEDIQKIVDAPYIFASQTIRDLELSNVKTEEDLDQLKTNFYFKCLFKLYVPFNRVCRRNKQKVTYKKINRNRWKKI